MLLMVKAIVRPEKVDDVLTSLMDAEFPSVTKISVFGRGKQRGLKVGEVHYDELPKEMLMMVVPEADKDFVIQTIINAARSGEKGSYGDGKIFVSSVESMYTISSGIKES
jgi:nitrogen regulatory protein PII 1